MIRNVNQALILKQKLETGAVKQIVWKYQERCEYEFFSLCVGNVTGDEEDYLKQLHDRQVFSKNR